LRATALRVDPAGALEGTVLERVHRRDHVRLLVEIDGEEYEAVGPMTEVGDRVRLEIDLDGVARIG
jgi:thiamine transport system ATP-binding protein